MSKYTHEYHFNLPQQRVAELIEAYFWCNCADDVVVANGFNNDPSLEDNNIDRQEFLISPTDKQGWSIVWTDRLTIDGEKMLFEISKDERCTVLYGHLNDATDNWRWIIIREGITMDQYWFTGQMWVRYPNKYKPEALTLWEAFKSLGREFHHFRITEIGCYEYRNFAASKNEFISISVLMDSQRI